MVHHVWVTNTPFASNLVFLNLLLNLIRMIYSVPITFLSDKQQLEIQITAFNERKKKIVNDLLTNTDEETKLLKLRIVSAIINDVQNELNLLIAEEEHQQEEIDEVLSEITEVVPASAPVRVEPAPVQVEPAQVPMHRASYASTASESSSVQVTPASVRVNMVQRNRNLPAIQEQLGQHEQFCGYSIANSGKGRCTNDKCLYVHDPQVVFTILTTSPLEKSLRTLSICTRRNDEQNINSICRFLLQNICIRNFLPSNNSGCTNSNCKRIHTTPITVQMLQFAHDNFLDMFCEVCHQIIKGTRNHDEIQECIVAYLRNANVPQPRGVPIPPPGREAFPALRR
jgi:hypothetical protein